MDSILALRPFVPAKDRAVSKAFYQALGFRATLEDKDITILKLESFSFILQNYYVKEFAEHCVIQMLVRNADAWWQRAEPARLVGEFAIPEPRPPAIQP